VVLCCGVLFLWFWLLCCVGYLGLVVWCDGWMVLYLGYGSLEWSACFVGSLLFALWFVGVSWFFFVFLWLFFCFCSCVVFWVLFLCLCLFILVSLFAWVCCCEVCLVCFFVSDFVCVGVFGVFGCVGFVFLLFFVFCFYFLFVVVV